MTAVLKVDVVDGSRPDVVFEMDIDIPAVLVRNIGGLGMASVLIRLRGEFDLAAAPGFHACAGACVTLTGSPSTCPS